MWKPYNYWLGVLPNIWRHNMKIFLSHSSRDKSLVREVRSYLPKHIRSWLDEDELLVGKDLEVSIKSAIQDEADFVVIFLGREAVSSEWVRKELAWALKQEKIIGRVFVLPVLLDDVWDEVEPKEFRSRIYLKCFDQSEAGVKGFANKLSEQLFVWLSQHLDESKKTELKEQHKAALSKAAGEALISLAKEETWKDVLSKNLARDYEELIMRLEDIPDTVKVSRIKERLERLIEKKHELTSEHDKANYSQLKEESNDELGSYQKAWDVIALEGIKRMKQTHRKHLELLEELHGNIAAFENMGKSSEQIMTHIRHFMLNKAE